MKDSSLLKTLAEHLPQDSVIAAQSTAASVYKQKFAQNISGIVLPANTDELRQIVLTAGRNKISIRVLANSNDTGSTTASSKQTTLLVDLKRMNQIIEVNKKGAYALIEPGVSFEQLYQYLQKNKTGLWIDCDRNGLNSVAGSVQAHEFGYTPYGDHMMMQCGMEVMLANGELTRIGMGALPGSNTWQLAKYAFGPYVDGLFTQSNLGIITKLGIWLMPVPPAYKPFMITLPNRDDIARAVEILRPLKINVIVPNSVVISHAMLDVAPYRSRQDFLKDAQVDLQQIKNEYELGEWNLYAALYNTPENVDVLWPMVREAFSSITGARIFLEDERQHDPIWTQREKLMRGIPVNSIDTLETWQGIYRCDIGIACPLNGEDILHLNSISKQVLNKYKFDELSECVVTWRSLIKRIHILFNEETKDSAINCINELINDAEKQGFGLTHARSNHPDMPIQQKANEGMTVLQHRLKKALDSGSVFV